MISSGKRPQNDQTQLGITHVWQVLDYGLLKFQSSNLEPFFSPSFNAIPWGYPPPINSHHQEYFIFSRESL